MRFDKAVGHNKRRKPKNRANKINLVFDEEKEGFHKRKLQRKKQAKEKFEKDLKEEKKKIKAEAKESYKKLVVSHRPIPELESLLEEEYEDEDATIKIIELSTNEIAKRNNWIGPNQPKYSSDHEGENDIEDDSNEEVEDIPGMELHTKKVKIVEKKTKKFETEKDVKKELKKIATKTVQKSKVFQMKNKMERQKQKRNHYSRKIERKV
ncbi:hypothetical protein HHI36_015769 [Cryptolaemus montrouzieri]|uniref:Nucleolar protein 12 n=1 Tax=Cryptolaemus montrouzieri TaxID=559131 RepID=A0ABD2N6L3_9CUCU